MIIGTVIEEGNGKLKVILTSDTDVGKAALKALDGASCKAVTDNLKIFDRSVSDGLVIEVSYDQQRSNSA